MHILQLTAHCMADTNTISSNFSVLLSRQELQTKNDRKIPELWGSLVISGRLPSEWQLFSTNKSIVQKNSTFHCSTLH